MFQSNIYKIKKIMPQSQFDEHVAITETLRTAEKTLVYSNISVLQTATLRFREEKGHVRDHPVRQ